MPKKQSGSKKPATRAMVKPKGKPARPATLADYNRLVKRAQELARQAAQERAAAQKAKTKPNGLGSLLKKAAGKVAGKAKTAVTRHRAVSKATRAYKDELKMTAKLEGAKKRRAESVKEAFAAYATNPSPTNARAVAKAARQLVPKKRRNAAEPDAQHPNLVHRYYRGGGMSAHQRATEAGQQFLFKMNGRGHMVRMNPSVEHAPDAIIQLHEDFLGRPIDEVELIEVPAWFPDDLMAAGKVVAIEYETTKDHLDGVPTIYRHEYAEEYGERPTMAFSPEGETVFVGGDWWITPEGIRN